jgi:phosphatidylserine/phosphatidylglycerophosphate/cardiolipin synthase-like enzyme
VLLLVSGCSSPSSQPDSGSLDDLPPSLEGPTPGDGPRPGCSPTDPRSAPVEVGVQPDEADQAYAQAIGRAQKTLRVFAYLLGTGGILDGLKKQAGAGKDVRVIVDGGGSANQKYFDELKAAGAKVQWSDTKFTNMHAKTIVVDDSEALISTGNYALYYINRERNFTALVKDRADVANLISLFDADWNHQPASLPCTRLLVSPINSRQRLLDHIKSAQKSLIVHSMQFADNDVRDAVIARKKAGVEVRALLADPSWVDANTVGAGELKAAGVPVRWLKSPAVHTKDIVVDGKAAYLGSINLSYTSLAKNREVGLIFLDAQVQRLVSAFEKDWSAATAF